MLVLSRILLIISTRDHDLIKVFYYSGLHGLRGWHGLEYRSIDISSTDCGKPLSNYFDPPPPLSNIRTQSNIHLCFFHAVFFLIAWQTLISIGAAALPSAGLINYIAGITLPRISFPRNTHHSLQLWQL